MMRFLKIGGVILSASILTTLGIMASDLTQQSSGLLGQLIATEESSVCPVGMKHVVTAQSFSCVDIYEASPGLECPHAAVRSPIHSSENVVSTACQAVSVADQLPWTYVTREQAAQLCARSGKRLPTAAEWYQIAIDAPTESSVCNVRSGRMETGQQSQCVSAVGAVNTVGNVWEWVSDDVIEGMFNGRALPTEGYVAQVDQSGVATVSTSSPQQLFSDDYVWTDNEGAYGVLRGGYFDSGSDGGIYAIQAKTVPTAATVATGFRCVQ